MNAKTVLGLVKKLSVQTKGYVAASQNIHHFSHVSKGKSEIRYELWVAKDNENHKFDSYKEMTEYIQKRLKEGENDGN